MHMKPIPEADRLNFIRTHLVTLPLRFAEPIVFGLHPHEVGAEAAWMRSATVSALEIKDRRFIVLNHHVVRLIRNAVAENTSAGSVRVQIGSVSVDIEAILLDIDEASDLAILDASGLELVRDERPDLVNSMTFDVSPRHGYVPLQFHKPSPWPATDVRPGDVILLGGYPEASRRNAGAEVTHGSWSMAGIPITGDGYDQFRVRFDREGWENQFGPVDDPTLLSRDLSGLSGSPVFVDRGGEGAMSSSLVGFVKEYEPQDDILVVTSATNLRSDGTLKDRPAPIIPEVG